MTPEASGLSNILCGHLRHMTARLRLLREDQWDWTFAPPAPSPRLLAIHAWQWLICDRQHIEEPDALKHHRIPDPPAEPETLCQALESETNRWARLLEQMTPEQMDTPRSQFNNYPMTVRYFVGHMVQNCIYKHGQFATIYFALGLDGAEPYTAPFPNPIYARLHEARDIETP